MVDLEPLVQKRRIAAVTALVLTGYAWGYLGVTIGLFPFPWISAVKQAIIGEPTLPPPPAYFERIRAFEMFMPQRKIDAVIIGDSISAGIEWQDVFPDSVIANRAIAGDTIAGVKARMNGIISTKASNAFIMIGINDALAGRDPNAIIADYQDVVATLRAAGMTVHVLTTLPCNDLAAACKKMLPMVEAVNADLKKMARPGVVVVDLAAALSSGRTLDRRFTYDGVHVNTSALHVWKSAMQAKLNDQPTTSNE